jgi:DNA-binding NtrC family response regulator
MTGEELLQACRESKKNTPIVMITAYGTITQAVDAMRLGAYDFITKPFSYEDIEHVVNRIRKQAVQSVTTENEPQKRKSQGGLAIVTNDPSMKELLETVTHVASSSANILIQGESGTGKELIAKLLHVSNKNIKGPFVAVNCAALPENLLESELFGHEKGSFTGALSTRIGKFEQADGGTLLLDEITEMPLSLQAKLLRVLQEKEVDRVGGSKPIPVEVRVVATTNRRIEEAVSKGQFREDLYYRLNVIPVVVPSLRERKGDVKLLIDYFVKKFADGVMPRISADVYKTLETYPWPGNIRELQNSCERAVLLSKGGEISEKYFMLGKGTINQSSIEDELTLKAGLSVSEAEKRLIVETLRVTDNNRTRAAELLGISIRTLRNKLNEYGEVDSDSMDS